MVEVETVVVTEIAIFRRNGKCGRQRSRNNDRRRSSVELVLLDEIVIVADLLLAAETVAETLFLRRFIQPIK